MRAFRPTRRPDPRPRAAPYRAAAAAALLAALAPAPARTQAAPMPELRLSGDLRIRAEYDDRTAGLPPDAAVLLRTRLGLAAAPGPGLRLFVQLADARAFGGPAGGSGDPAAAHPLDVHQAYLEWQPTPRLALRAGRQELTFADERLVGPVGWANVNRAFDALRATLRARPGSLHLFAATVRERDALLATGLDPRRNEGRDEDRIFAGAWLESPGADAFGLVDRNGETSRATGVQRHTLGAYLRARPGPWTLVATAALQLGRQRPAGPDPAPERRRIHAFLLSGQAGYTPRPADGPAVGARLDYLSGDDRPDDDTDRAFDTVFATNHPFYGHMDLFLDIPAQTGGRGLVDAVAQVSLRHGVWTARADLHYLALARPDAHGERRLGLELDLGAARTLAPGIELSGGYSVFRPAAAAPGPGLALGSETLHWGYLQVTASF